MHALNRVNDCYVALGLIDLDRARGRHGASVQQMSRMFSFVGRPSSEENSVWQASYSAPAGPEHLEVLLQPPTPDTRFTGKRRAKEHMQMIDMHA